jgi:sigma-B regulation protein RsbQ
VNVSVLAVLPTVVPSFTDEPSGIACVADRAYVPLALPAADVLHRNHVRVSGRADGRPLVFVHGFACDQRMWEQIAAALESEFRVVTLDLIGAGQSDVTAYDVLRHGRVDGYATDLVEIAAALDLRDAVAIGHSFGATVGMLAHIAAPERFGALVLIGPSARYVDDPVNDYVGGLSEDEVEGLLEIIETNFTGWATAMAPTIMGNPERPQLALDLADTYRGTDPEIAARWARVTFHTDVRPVLASVSAPAVVLQSADDPIVPVQTGRWLANHLPGGAFVQLRATGHCPHLSAPEETLAEIRRFLDGR